MDMSAHREFCSFDAFEKVLRKYGHPAAVADLDALPRGGPSWSRLLEALTSTCRDNAAQWSDQWSVDGATLSDRSDKNCIIVHALVEMCGPQMIKHLSEEVCAKMQNNLKRYGRPLLSKQQMLSEHNARVHYHNLSMQEMKAKGLVSTRQTSNSVRKEAESKECVDFSKLEQIYIRGMKLYDSTEGSFLEGKLLVDPFTPTVGCTTILEDSNGDVVLLALYNFLPDGLHGEESIPVASAKIPKGCTIRIAAPFMKVFRDGSRDIRIDDPNDISIVTESGGYVNEDHALSRAKALGNSLVQKKMYNAASDAYIEGLRKADMVPTILSNRSQAYGMLDEWEQSLADAAASLVIRPDNKKTWSRYENAITKLQVGKMDSVEKETVRQILRQLLVLAPGNKAMQQHDNRKNARELKNEGNNWFKKKEYNKAVGFYTAALETCGEVPRAILGNWALCCLHSRVNLDAVASAAASLRIRPEAKALARLAKGLFGLGEPKLSCSILRGKYSSIFEGSPPAITRDIDEILRCGENVFDTLKTNGIIGRFAEEPKYIPQWIGKIETFDAGPSARESMCRPIAWSGGAY